MQGGTLKLSQLLIKVQGHTMLIFLSQFRTNVSESVIRLVPAKLLIFLEARMLYDKCIEN